MKVKKVSLEMMPAMWWMSAGREFQTDGPTTENARSPNLVILMIQWKNMRWQSSNTH